MGKAKCDEDNDLQMAPRQAPNEWTHFLILQNSNKRLKYCRKADGQVAAAIDMNKETELVFGNCC